MSRDTNGIGVKSPIPSRELNSKNIEAGINKADVSPTVGIAGRGTIIEFNEDCSAKKTPTQAGNLLPGEGGSAYVITYPDGKDKNTVNIGEIVKIGDEEFYVINRNGDDLYLLAHYNLKVGNIFSKITSTIVGEYVSSDPGYGIQSSETLGFHPTTGTDDYSNGAIPFSETNYWAGKVGTTYPGEYCASYNDTNCAYIYDSNSNLYQHISNYKSYLVGLGAVVKEARLMTLDESRAFSSAKHAAWCETSYWLGSVHDETVSFHVYRNGAYFSSRRYDNRIDFGIRPVIVI